MYLIAYYSANGQRMTVEQDHMPTLADIPQGAVRMDIALPYEAPESHAQRMQRLSDGVRLAMGTETSLALI